MSKRYLPNIDDILRSSPYRSQRQLVKDVTQALTNMKKKGGNSYTSTDTDDKKQGTSIVPSTIESVDLGSMKSFVWNYKWIPNLSVYKTGEITKDFWYIVNSNENKKVWLSMNGWCQNDAVHSEGLAVFANQNLAGESLNSVRILNWILFNDPTYNTLDETGSFPANTPLGPVVNAINSAVIIRKQWAEFYIKNISPVSNNQPTPAFISVYTLVLDEDLYVNTPNTSGAESTQVISNPSLLALARSMSSNLETDDLDTSTRVDVLAANNESRAYQQFQTPWIINMGDADLSGLSKGGILSCKKFSLPVGVQATIRIGISKPQYHNFDHVNEPFYYQPGNNSSTLGQYLPKMHKKGETIIFLSCTGGVTAKTTGTSPDFTYTGAVIEPTRLAIVGKSKFTYKVIPRANNADEWQYTQNTNVSGNVTDIDINISS